MMLLCLLFLVAWKIDGSLAQNDTSGGNISDAVYSINFNASYCDGKRWDLLVQESGLGFNISVLNTTLDSDTDEYLRFSADENFDSDMASVVYITGLIEKVKLAIPLTKTAYIEYSPGGGCNGNTSFEINVVQLDVVVPEPPPIPPNPYPPTDIRTSIGIYIAGKTLQEFTEPVFNLNFKTFIQENAFAFSKRIGVENIDLSKPANETVFFSKIQPCPKNWDNQETCVEINMAVYVTKLKTDYDLTITHLEKFWKELTKDKFPDTLGVQPYDANDAATDILWWILWLFIAIAITIGLGTLFWWFQRRAAAEQAFLKEVEEYERRQQIFANVDMRRKPNLRPGKHQQIPDFMSKNADNASVLSAPLVTSRVLASNTPSTSSPLPDQPSPLHSPAIVTRPAFFSNSGFVEEDEDDSQMGQHP